jgi:predicted Zn-ribbon and HTH transcriptional regulator
MALAIFKKKGVEEKKISKIAFTIYKFNNRPKPKKTDRIKIISCFSEFGCEVLGPLYCMPRLMKRYPGQYIIAVGWYGREYLYRHLVDEFWEIGEEYMWLRDYARAFHNVSRNLKKLEEALTVHGDVIPSAALGKYAIANMCKTCGKFWQEWRMQYKTCPSCKSTVIVKSIFTDIAGYKPQAKRIPRPSKEMLDWAKSVVKPNSIGIFARARKTYGRNLSPEFYVRLIRLLEGMGYNIVWLGEKQSTLPCPLDHIIDFSNNPKSRDLEKTLAIICNLDFTIQFWTASTRLSAIMGTPFILFESPEQVYVSLSGIMGAQEGKRLELCSFGPKKVVISHYHSANENHDAVLQLVERAVTEMKADNWDDILGLVQDEWFSQILQNEHYEMLT